MYSLIEIYDNQQRRNILINTPFKISKVYFLYRENQMHLINNPIVEKYVNNEKIYIKFDDSNFNNTLQEIINNENYLLVDFNGGDDKLLALTMRYLLKHNINKDITLLFPDYNFNSLKIIHNDEQTNQLLKPIKFTIEDILGLHGASRHDVAKNKKFYQIDDLIIIQKIIQIFRNNPLAWVSFASVFGEAQLSNTNNYFISNKLIHNHIPIKQLNKIINQLDDINIFAALDYRKNGITYRFNDERYKHLLINAGLVFEYDIYLQLLKSNYFDDIDIGITIDWNGDNFNYADPISEIDVMATIDGIIVFISCKSRTVQKSALDELYVNMRKFGGNQAVGLLCVYKSFDQNAEIFNNKAQQLDIEVVYKQQLDNNQLLDIIKRRIELVRSFNE